MEYDLSKFTNEQLVEIQSTLNGWIWHPLLGETPKNFYRMMDYRSPKLLDNLRRHYYSLRNAIHSIFLPSKSDLISPIVEKIGKIVGKKAGLRYNWLNNLHRTEAEFEEWYYGEYKEFQDYHYEKYGGDFFKFEP